MSAHNVGGITFNLKDGTTGHCVLGGKNLEYRYSLERYWGDGEDRIMFVMMNPSTATETQDDPTVAKCVRFAKKWGYRGLYVGNTFAYRATDQKRLAEVEDPVGPDCMKHLAQMATLSDCVVFAYGTPQVKSLLPRGLEVVRELQHRAGIQPYVLRLTEKTGRPYHPLYLPESLTPQEWNP